MKTFKLMKKVENIVAEGEIARFEQFLLLSLRFQKSSKAAKASESDYMWESHRLYNTIFNGVKVITYQFSHKTSFHVNWLHFLNPFPLIDTF